MVKTYFLMKPTRRGGGPEYVSDLASTDKSQSSVLRHFAKLEGNMDSVRLRREGLIWVLFLFHKRKFPMLCGGSRWTMWRGLRKGLCRCVRGRPFARPDEPGWRKCAGKGAVFPELWLEVADWIGPFTVTREWLAFWGVNLRVIFKFKVQTASWWGDLW